MNLRDTVEGDVERTDEPSCCVITKITRLKITSEMIILWVNLNSSPLWV